MNKREASGRYGDRKNEEGYYDLTAYEAMKGATKMKSGQLISVERLNDYRTGVVLQGFDVYTSYLMLCEKRPEQNAMEIFVNGKTFFLNLGMVNFTYNTKVEELDEVIDKETMERVRSGICAALSLNRSADGEDEKVRTLEAEIKKLSELNDKLSAENDRLVEQENACMPALHVFEPSEDVTELKIENARLKERADIFEGMYKELLRGKM